MLSLLRPCSLNRSLPGSPRPSWKTAQKLPPQMKGQDQTSQVRLVTWVCAPSAPHAGPPRASLLVLAADIPHLPGWPWLVAACSPRCPRHQSHPTHPWPHVGSGDLLCPMSSCLVYVRVSGCDPELASPFKFLPLGSAHTVHKASQRNATWKKNTSKKKKKHFTTKCPFLCRQLCLAAVFPMFATWMRGLHTSALPSSAASAGSPHHRAGQGAPRSCPHLQGSSQLPRGWGPAQSHLTAAKTCFCPACIPYHSFSICIYPPCISDHSYSVCIYPACIPYCSFSICFHPVLHLVLSSQGVQRGPELSHSTVKRQ